MALFLRKFSRRHCFKNVLVQSCNKRPTSIRLMSLKTVGILDECYNKWERRAPLCPWHVSQLAKDGFKVVVQPSKSRIFFDHEYASAGANMSRDLSVCDLILGVKQPNISQLLSNKTYMFFAHVIKGQQENRELLSTILNLGIRLLDYECIRETGGRTAPRLVAFGKYAGFAGMINTFPALGQKLLAHGYSTPFLNVSSAYMYRDLHTARQNLLAIGGEIRKGALESLDFPIVFAFTGNGNVSRGAQEIFHLLPHKFVSVSQLPSIWNSKGPHRCVYGCLVKDEDMVFRRGATLGSAFDVTHYRAEPHLYEPIFHSRVAPYTSVLVNGIYWDQRYPRLITRADLARLHSGREEDERRPLLVVSDISCDIHGSVEFLERSTTIEKPYFDFDPCASASESNGSTGGAIVDSIGRRGVTVMGVDILPSELPREASSFFGDRLEPILRDLLSASGPMRPLSDLPPHIKGACITDAGQLAPGYTYISTLMEQRKRESEAIAAARAAGGPRKVPGRPGAELRLHGHLFDSNLINQVLGVIEASGATFGLAECLVRPGQKTSALVTVDAGGDADRLEGVITKVEKLVAAVELADATLVVVRPQPSPPPSRLDTSAESSRSQAESMDSTVQLHGGAGGGYLGDRFRGPAGRRTNVLVLGAGRVASSLVGYLGREPATQVVVASALLSEAEQVARRARNGIPIQLQVASGAGSAGAIELDQLVRDADVVVSLLPAGLHSIVARACIDRRVHLVTSSYVSPEMRALESEAKAAGVLLLCECGLDPGMDHMSAVRAVQVLRRRGGRISHFSSVCGGLPAPEAAENNPLMYKLSWSPRGFLAATCASARWRRDGRLLQVAGADLLTSATPLHTWDSSAWPSLRLEVLPNRDSMVYEELYGVEGSPTVFRGTLRYEGFSEVMLGLQRAGFLRDEPARTATGVAATSWDQVERLVALRGGAAAAADFLGINSANPLAVPTSILESLCRSMEVKLAYSPGERDMVLMRHEVRAVMPSGAVEVIHSGLRVLGDPIGSLSEAGGIGDTAMGKTVGLAAGVCARIVLEGKLQGMSGVVTPVLEEVYVPALALLAQEGLEFEERESILPATASS